MSKSHDVQLWDRKREESKLSGSTVSGLYVYPIKSCGGVSIQATQLTAKGLLHDREWAIIDGTRNKVVTQRRYPKLALVHPKVLPRLDAVEAEAIVLIAKGMSELIVPVQQAGDGSIVRNVAIWADTVEAVDQGDAAAAWLDSFLGEEPDCSFRLVKAKEGFTRYTKPEYALGHSTNFADAFPFLLALEESLEEFNTMLDNPVPMNRFRPNIVVRGSPAFADEHWDSIAINGMLFRNVRPCSRCGMPSVNQATGEVHLEREPSRTIVRERNGARLGFTNGKKCEGYFGSNLVLESEDMRSIASQLAVGVPVKVLTLKSEVVA